MALSQTRATRPCLPAALATGAALLACGLFVAVELRALDHRLGFPLDDAWIHLAFARNLAAGHGLGVDPGELVAGSTSPLWTAFAAVGVAAPVPDVLWMKLLGLAFHLGGVLLTWSVSRELGLGTGLSALATGFTVATGWLAWSALSGMEISLFVALTLAGLLLHLRERRRPERPPLSLAVLGVSVLARPEGLLLLGLAWGDRLLRFRRRPDGALAWHRSGAPGATRLRRSLAGLGLAALAFVPVAAFYSVLGGSPLPTTLAAKTGGGGEGLHPPSLQYLHTALGILFRSLPWAVVLAPAGALALVRRLGTRSDAGLLPALWPVALPLAYSCLTASGGTPLVGNFGRYLFPLMPWIAILAALGLEPVATALRPARTGAPLRRALAAAGVLLVLWPTLADLPRTAGLYARNLRDVADGDVAMAHWLAKRVPPEAVIATVDLGAMAALLPNPILDLVGIADPEVHDHVRRVQAEGGSWQDGVLAFIAEERPDYLVVFPDWLDAFDRPGTPFRRIHTIRVPGNVTLGRDTLAAYATPWTRHPLRNAGPPEPRPRPEEPPTD
ncbi:MAG: hypothetical protein ACLF0P_01295 [Thermoanaerobaculia bacterium]